MEIRVGFLAEVVTGFHTVLQEQAQVISVFPLRAAFGKSFENDGPREVEKRGNRKEALTEPDPNPGRVNPASTSRATRVDAKDKSQPPRSTANWPWVLGQLNSALSFCSSSVSGLR